MYKIITNKKEEIEEDLDIEDKEGDYETNVLYAEMVAEQVISY